MVSGWWSEQCSKKSLLIEDWIYRGLDSTQNILGVGIIMIYYPLVTGSSSYFPGSFFFRSTPGWCEACSLANPRHRCTGGKCRLESGNWGPGRLDRKLLGGPGGTDHHRVEDETRGTQGIFTSGMSLRLLDLLCHGSFFFNPGGSRFERSINVHHLQCPFLGAHFWVPIPFDCVLVVGMETRLPATSNTIISHIQVILKCQYQVIFNILDMDQFTSWTSIWP